jgi:farnesyl diphosphate synthase
MPTSNFSAWSSARRAALDATLGRVLPEARIEPRRLHEAMRYAVLDGGKRIRPLLVYAAGELSHANAARLDVAACAVELIHVYSLVHDDMPSMDDDALRRGKPTVHVQYDEATALLVGDALQSLAFQVLSEQSLCDDAARQLGMIARLALASGSRGMAGGQAIDLDSVNRALSLPELEYMHILKTGALIRTAVMMGAGCGAPLGEPDTQRLDHAAKCMGLAFQVVDDVLDATASSATLGKTAGKDADANKPTFVSLLGLEASRARARELADEARDALAGFGDGARRLNELARLIVERQF